jgi:pimeloyl-ACP methyl ester carboxylesterase
MTGTFIFVHGTGVPDADDDRARIRQMLENHAGFHDWDVVCPPWGERIGGTWGDPLLALPPEQRPPAAEAAVAEGLSFDSLVTQISDELEAAIANQLIESGDEFRIAVPGWILKLATDVIADNRAAITYAAGNFIRNVFFYFHHRERVRDWVSDRLAEERGKNDGPIVVAGHSLGGVIAVDTLTHRPLPRVLAVTAGSQLPLFAVLRLSDPLGGGGVKPFAPWLNFYNPRDPLSFFATTVFPEHPVFPPGDGRAAQSPADALIEEPENLPYVHAGYFEQPAIYEGIWNHLETVGLR